MYQLKTYVIRDGAHTSLGRNGLAMLHLGIAKIQYVSENDIEMVNSVDNLCKRCREISENKLGAFKKTKIGAFKKTKITLHVKDNGVSKYFKPRPVPFGLKEKIEQ